MNLFIDTNIFLTFYHLSGKDIEELKKLSVLIDQKKVTLRMPEQVCKEFYRNRDVKIKDALKELKKASFSFGFPAFCKNYQEYDDLKKLMKEANKKHSELTKVVTDHAKSGELNADGLINQLFEKSKKIEITPDIYSMSLLRMRSGNPPGKNGVTIGDEINWEALLTGVNDNEDIHVVSNDSDYVAPLDDSALHPFLEKEWITRKKSNILFYSKISDFFKKHYPEIKIASEIEKSLAIQSLAGSGSFASTHIAILKLCAFNEFTAQEVDTLITILMGNSQVGLIFGDVDVYSFYKRIYTKYSEYIDADKLTFLKELFAENEDTEKKIEKLKPAF